MQNFGPLCVKLPRFILHTAVASSWRNGAHPPPPPITSKAFKLYSCRGTVRCVIDRVMDLFTRVLSQVVLKPIQIFARFARFKPYLNVLFIITTFWYTITGEVQRRKLKALCEPLGRRITLWFVDRFRWGIETASIHILNASFVVELTYLMQNFSALRALSLWFVLHFLTIIKVKVQF